MTDKSYRGAMSIYKIYTSKKLLTIYQYTRFSQKNKVFFKYLENYDFNIILFIFLFSYICGYFIIRILYYLYQYIVYGFVYVIQYNDFIPAYLLI